MCPFVCPNIHRIIAHRCIKSSCNSQNFSTFSRSSDFTVDKNSGMIRNPKRYPLARALQQINANINKLRYYMFPTGCIILRVRVRVRVRKMCLSRNSHFEYLYLSVVSSYSCSVSYLSTFIFSPIINRIKNLY